MKRLIIAVLLCGLLACLMGAEVSAEEQSMILRPNGTGVYNGLTPVGDTTGWKCVDDITPDNDTYVHFVSGQWAVYELTDLSEAVTISKVTVYMRAINVSGYSRTASLVVRTNDTNSTGATETITGEYTTFSWELETNPVTGLSWTVSEVNSLQAGVIVSGTNVRLTQIYVKIDYYPIIGEIIDTSTYDAFGVLVKTSDTGAIYFYRESSSHNQPGIDKIAGRAYDFTTETWGEAWDVYYNNNPSLLTGNIGGGIIGGCICLFFQMQDTDVHTVDCGYIVSTDLTGTSWSERIVISTPGLSGRINMNISPLIETGIPGTYLKLIAGSDDTQNPLIYRILVLKTTDSGATWGIGSEVYSGYEYMAEPSVAYIGDGKIVALIRYAEGDTGNYVLQCVSSDNGQTWSEIQPTNMGEPTGKKIPTLIYDPEFDDLIVYYHDRYDGTSYVAHGAAQSIFSDSQAWQDITVIEEGFIYNGYGSLVKTGTGEYLVVYSVEMTGSDADIWWQEISFEDIPSEVPDDYTLILVTINGDDIQVITNSEDILDILRELGLIE